MKDLIGERRLKVNVKCRKGKCKMPKNIMKL